MLSVRRQLLIFYGVAAIAMVVLSLGAVVASRSVAQGAALGDAERTTVRMSELVVSPFLVGATNGDRDQLSQLQKSVAARMRDGYLVRVTVWDGDGRVLYANDTDLIGRQFPVPDEVTAAIGHGTVSSDFATQAEASEPTFDSGSNRYVEVYVPLALRGQDAVAFEAYYDYARVTEVADSLLRQILPLVLVPIIALQFIQVPIAASLARRVRRQEAERTLWLEQTLSGSDRERMRIAGDLHDGSIQDLAGIAYALGAIASGVAERDRALMETVQEAVFRANESLRRMMIEVYPPDLDASQLPNTIADLAVPLREKNIEVSVIVGPLPDLESEAVATLYRVAREALLNVVEHAQATEVKITLAVERSRPGASCLVVLVVEDNGVGLAAEQLDRRAEGHLGLRLLRDRVAYLHGTMTFAAGSSGGAVITVTLPGNPVAGRARANRKPWSAYAGAK